MKCIICHGEEIKVKEVKEDFKIEEDIICVPIKIPVCENCGERYYDRRTIKCLEEIEKKLKRKELNLKEIGKVLMFDKETIEV